MNVFALKVLFGLLSYQGFTDGTMMPSLQNGGGIVITQGQGGYIDQHENIINYVKAQNKFILVDGTCASACTMFLSLPKENFCYTDRAVFKFHSASTGLTTQVMSANGNSSMIKYFPKVIRQWIKKSGAYTSLEFTDMPADVLSDNYSDKHC